jgi:hypothetical protein
MSNRTILISTPEALSKFILEVDRLHDAVLHEAVLLHRAYVDRERQMWRDTELPNARLIFQSQSPDFSAVLLILHGVTLFRFDPRLEFRLEGEFDGRDLVLYLTAKSNASQCEIRAAKAEYVLLAEDFLGDDYRLATGIVSN